VRRPRGGTAGPCGGLRGSAGICGGGGRRRGRRVAGRTVPGGLRRGRAGGSFGDARCERGPLGLEPQAGGRPDPAAPWPGGGLGRRHPGPAAAWAGGTLARQRLGPAARAGGVPQARLRRDGAAGRRRRAGGGVPTRPGTAPAGGVPARPVGGGTEPPARGPGERLALAMPPACRRAVSVCAWHTHSREGTGPGVATPRS
jgi:hypothetical protein